MFNLFKKKNQFKSLRDYVATFAILDEFASRGIIHYHATVPTGSPGGAKRGGSLLIEESLATLKLAEGAEGFKHFLEQVTAWQNYKLLQDAYETHRIDTEAKAVRDAKALLLREGRGGSLSKTDIQRIRQNARTNMEPIATVTDGFPSVQEFDLFIIRATAPSAEEALNSLPREAGRGSGQLLALGHWDGKNLEMALYDDIKNNL